MEMSTYQTSASSSYMDILDDGWANLDLNDPMMAYVSPNLICPTEILLQEPQVFGNVTNITNQQTENNYSAGCNIANINQSNSSYYHSIGTKIIPDMQAHQQFDQHQQQLPLNQCQYQYQTLIDLPPNLASHDEPKLGIQEHLRLHRELSKQRQDRIKARLERQPPQLPYQLLRKASGKKLTGRERQVELERQEAQQRQLRDHYLDLISQLESKCNKLREILENIVTTSPDYNNQMMIYLETEKLLHDQSITTSQDPTNVPTDENTYRNIE